jgi:hypothetical protein
MTRLPAESGLERLQAGIGRIKTDKKLNCVRDRGIVEALFH